MPRSHATLATTFGASLLALCALTPVGCVTKETHTQTLTELEAVKKLSAEQAAELDAFRKQTRADADQMKQQLAALLQSLDEESSSRKAAESSVSQLKGDIQEAQQQADSLAKEREALKARSDELQSRLDGLEKEKGQLGSDFEAVRGRIKELEQQLASGNASAQDEIAQLRQRAKELEGEAARIAREREQLQQQQSQLAASLEQERQRLTDEEAEKARLERERAAKEEEIKRLARTQEELSRSLQDEIAKGNITIQRVRDRLTINMIDRVLFDSGQAKIKPAGLKVLKQVGDVLSKVTDKQIRIEGHTDNVPISTRLQNKFQTNWELSTARATTVVRYLIDHGGVDRQYFSAVGYADNRPVASNEGEPGRASNRRIEIVLYPKDLSQIAGDLDQKAADTAH